MLFNSISFAIFLPIIFAVYWFLTPRNHRAQNIILLLSSYYFYGSWDWRFLGLLAFSTALDYFSGLKIHNAKSDTSRKTWLFLSVGINLGFLGWFKYYNFFVDSFASLLSTAGFEANIPTLNVILPIGISFYTFHGLSYVFDIYNRRIVPSTNIVEYSLFVSFFPLLVAGPIERATHLLPQIERPRIFKYSTATDGLRQMLWGFFKKIVIADNCAQYANLTFEDPSSHSASTLLVGAIFFAFQIYGDFSGYSDIALGTARLFGFELLKNFAFPYFSRDIAEFWRRWHISLSSWFKDYLYFPLGGSRGGKYKSLRNTLIIFAVSGFWHGANWTFIVWGVYHGLLFVPLLLLGKNRRNTNTVAQGKIIPSIYELIQMITTFVLVVIGWIFFRSESIEKAFVYIAGILNKSLLSMPLHTKYHTTMLLVTIMIAVEWFGRHNDHALQLQKVKFSVVRWACYLAIFMVCLANFKQNQEFIYFQF
ncbi:MBOAT family protein [Dyadobacter sp. CY347]|uniref:MBOAT family O-acyltransferase n=1 Tax=Dyadobacter sp. CY347 TaxID=2909336 RepID=UPI001F44BFB2|nr:MBOAT family O-acyltransferase [Dyadobacter sp. CY347]MCF2487356.1 MBOAT family protein [Dyadobacter sp. CY347]